jgi:hypothetical protein
MSKKNASRRKTILSALVIVIVSLVIIVGLMIFISQKNTSKNLQSNSYHAIYLNNGKVYFGKIDAQQEDFLHLKDIYYIELEDNKESDDAQTNETESNKNSASEEPELKLIKRGNEIHQPKDEMLIPQNSITFIEEIRSDSRVLAAIKNHKSQ